LQISSQDKVYGTKTLVVDSNTQNCNIPMENKGLIAVLVSLFLLANEIGPPFLKFSFLVGVIKSAEESSRWIYNIQVLPCQQKICHITILGSKILNF
jgi:hypothetical protein